MSIDKDVAECALVTGLERLAESVGVLAERNVSGRVEIGEPVALVTAGKLVRSRGPLPVGLEMPT